MLVQRIICEVHREHTNVAGSAYAAFNDRDIERALALMSENVSWPKASEGGYVVGKEEVRSYWTRQWREFDPHVNHLRRSTVRALPRSEFIRS